MVVTRSQTKVIKSRSEDELIPYISHLKRTFGIKQCYVRLERLNQQQIEKRIQNCGERFPDAPAVQRNPNTVKVPGQIELNELARHKYSVPRPSRISGKRQSYEDDSFYGDGCPQFVKCEGISLILDSKNVVLDCTRRKLFLIILLFSSLLFLFCTSGNSLQKA